MTMQGKGLRSVIIGVLALCLVVAQTQVKAQEETCCRNEEGRHCYHKCRLTCTAPFECGTRCNCICLNQDLNSDVGEAKGYSSNCPTAEATGCFSRCRLTAEACAKECACTLTAIDCPTTEASDCFDTCRDVPESVPELCATNCTCNLIPPAYSTDCPTTEASDCFNRCRLAPELCAEKCACTRNTIHCPTTQAKGCFGRCRAAPWKCAENCACTFISGNVGAEAVVTA